MKCQNRRLQQCDRLLLLRNLSIGIPKMCVAICLACDPESSRDTSEKRRADPSCSHTEGALQPLTARRVPT